MIASLRQRHYRMFAVLGVLLPVLLVTGIAARRNVPQAESLPLALTSQTAGFLATEHARHDLFAKSGVQARLWREQGTERLAVELIAAKDFLKPDLMAYWSAEPPVANDLLPPNASLLGTFGAGPLALPEEAAVKDGFLILFSLANQEIVDVSKPTRLTAPTR